MANPTETALATVESIGSETSGSSSSKSLALLANFDSEPEATPEAAQAEPVVENNKADLSQPENMEAEPGTEPGAVEAEVEPETPAEAKPKEGEQDARPTKGVDHRINQLTARAKSAEEKLQQLEARNRELEEKAAGQPKNADQEIGAPKVDPLMQHPILKPVVAEMTEAQKLRDGARAALDQFEDDPDAVVQRLVELKCLPETTDARNAKVWLKQQERIAGDKLADARVKLETHRNQAAASVAQAFEADRKLAFETYPWHADEQSPERKMVDDIVKEFPGVVHHPNRLMIIGQLVEGRKLEAAKRAAKNGKPKGEQDARPTPPRMAGASTAMPATAKKPDPGSATMQKAVKTRKPEDMARALESF